MCRGAAEKIICRALSPLYIWFRNQHEFHCSRVHAARVSCSRSEVVFVRKMEAFMLTPVRNFGLRHSKNGSPKF